MNLLLVGGGLAIVALGLSWLKAYFAPPDDVIGSHVSEEELVAVNRGLWRQGDLQD